MNRCLQTKLRQHQKMTMMANIPRRKLHCHLRRRRKRKRKMRNQSLKRIQMRPNDFEGTQNFLLWSRFSCFSSITQPSHHVVFSAFIIFSKHRHNEIRDELKEAGSVDAKDVSSRRSSDVDFNYKTVIFNTTSLFSIKYNTS